MEQTSAAAIPAGDSARAGTAALPVRGLISAIDGVDGVGARLASGSWPSRLPASSDSRIPAPFMRVVAEMPAGVRVATRTAATTLHLDFRATQVRLPEQETPVPARLSVVVDGVLHAELDITAPHTVLSPDGSTIGYPDVVATQRWEIPNLPDGEKLVEIWLPQSALIDDISLHGDHGLLTPPEPTRPTWVHYGSSISHCLEADSPVGTWPAIAASRLGLDSTNFAFAGSAMLDPFMARIIRDSVADLISLKVGINLVNIEAAHRRLFRSLLDGFLDTIRDGHPLTPIVLCSPIACPALEPGGAAGPTGGPFLTLSEIRDDIALAVAQRQHTDHNLHYIPGLELLGHDEADAFVDGVHPGPEGYARIGNRFADHIIALGLSD